MAAGALVVNVVSRTAKANKGMRGYRKEVKATRMEVKLAGRAFKSMRTGLVGLASVAAAKSAFSNLTRVADDLTKIGDTADRLGLTSQALQELHFAGKQTGVSIETTNMALQRMTRRVAEAAKGTGEAKAALKEMGLNAKELVRLSPDRQLHRIADAMQRVKIDADQVRLSMKLFDSEGVALKNTLSDGSEGLRRFGDEARRINGSISRDLKDVREFSASMQKLSDAWGGLKRELVIDIAPGATKAIEGLSEFAAWSRDIKNATVAGAKGGPGPLDGLQAFKDTMRNAFERRQFDAGKMLAQTMSSGGAVKRVPPLATVSESIRVERRQRSASFGSARRAIEQSQSLRRFFRSVGQEMGRLSNEVNNGNFFRKQDRLPQRILPGGGMPGVNSLIEANSREGHLALNANRRAARDSAAKHAQATAKSTKATADNTKAIADGVRQTFDMLAKTPLINWTGG